MNHQTLFIRALAVALAIGLVGCASQPPPRSRTYYAPPPPKPSGYVSVRSVQPTTTAQTAPVADTSAAAERTRQQGHKRRALAYLQTARANLEASTATRSGHRRDAVRFTDEAIGHVEAGIAHANAR